MLLGADGTVSASSVREYPLATPQPGWAEQDPEDWWRGTVEVIRELVAAAKGETVAGLGLTGQMHGATFLDAQGEVIRPAILWCDQRTEAECAEITSAVGSTTFSASLRNRADRFPGDQTCLVRNHAPGTTPAWRSSSAQGLHKISADGSDVFGRQRRPGRRVRCAEPQLVPEVLSALKIPAGGFEAVEGTARTGVVKGMRGSAGLKGRYPVAAGGGDQAAARWGRDCSDRRRFIHGRTSVLFFAYANERGSIGRPIHTLFVTPFRRVARDGRDAERRRFAPLVPRHVRISGYDE